MTSAFLPVPRQAFTQKLEDNHYDSHSSDEEDETEDEEVKLSCVGGVADSDVDMDTFDSDNDSDTDDDDEEEDDCDSHSGEPEKPHGLLRFVSHCPSISRVVIRPRARLMSSLSPPVEGNDDEEDEESDASSVGARGVPLAVDETGSVSEGSSEDDNEFVSSLKSSVAVERAEDSLNSTGSTHSDSDDDSEFTHEEPDAFRHGASNQSPYTEDHFGRIIVGVSNDCPWLDESPRTKHKLVPASIITVDSMEMDHRAKRRKSDFDSDSSLAILPLSADTQPSGDSRGGNGHISSCSEDDDVALDGQLREELDGYDGSCLGDKSPVPLLTPPVSPQPLPLTRDDSSVVFEWPSNLAVDNAMRSVITDIPPLSPVSLATHDLQKDSSDLLTARSPLLNGLSIASLQL
mmetsp:Transcript_17970/g.42400  ORF Transcript_17970/g.42400 Transcript_17970/m.42400 type:complete len:404 (+) Transcript_17970:313-1524(+)